MKIAILGSGPSGLVAAAAITEVAPNAEMQIFSLGNKSMLYGAQYLHEPIPNFTRSAPVEICYHLEGSSDVYRRKVYGDDLQVEVSPDTLEENHFAWDIRSTYDMLWRRYENQIIKMGVSREALEILSRLYDIVISTIPANNLCYKGAEHDFVGVKIVAAGSAPDRGILLNSYEIAENTIVCSGEADTPWYRASNIFGHKTVEFSTKQGHRAPASAAIVNKPVSTTCTCWRGMNIHQVGRYGEWKKGVLVHDVYHQTKEILWRGL